MFGAWRLESARVGYCFLFFVFFLPVLSAGEWRVGTTEHPFLFSFLFLNILGEVANAVCW